MADSDKQPIIIIKKVKKVQHAGHHGGGWKVAYADFVTAMMAFFLLLWLLNSVTSEQMTGIADYFTPTVASISQGGAGGVMGGRSMLAPGAAKSPKSERGDTVSLVQLEETEDPDYEGKPGKKRIGVTDVKKITAKEARAVLRQKEQSDFEQAAAELREAIGSSEELKGFAENLSIDLTDEGMRIQITDGDNISMFPHGSARMYGHTERLLQKIVKVIAPMNNDIAVIGHTDASPYRGNSGRTNWELSTDRANASRRALVGGGLPDWRVARISGRADHDLLIVDEPMSPRNRRIDIVLLRNYADILEDK